MERSSRAALLLMNIWLLTPLTSYAQQAPPGGTPPPAAQQPAQPAQPARPAPLDNTLEAGNDEVPEPARNLVSWNHFDGKYTTFRFGAGFLYDFGAFAQNETSKEQIEVHPLGKVRDARLLFNGKLKTKRPITWTAAFMYDVPTKSFLLRQTGVMIDVPEISGQIFIGRQKEGFSLLKVMVGYAGWTMERQPISDATVPILADGVKWLGYAPKKHLIWNLGFYGDAFSEDQSFSTYTNQVVGRLAYLPIMTEAAVLHLGGSLRYGRVKDDTLRLRSRPELFVAPYFIDTGPFPARSTNMAELEAYYRPGSVTAGTEYFFQFANAPTVGNPFFHGGNAFAAWVITGEIRPYNTRGGYFDQISPDRPVFQGGPGAWELVGNVSYTDLNGGSVRGGTFWRISPLVNWYMSDNVRLIFEYGYGSLNRFNLVGKTQFFQTRIQFQL